MTKQELELKNYLQKTRFIKISLEYEINRLQELRVLVYSVKTPTYSTDKISGGEIRNKLEDDVIKLLDFEERLKEKINNWQSMVEEREHMISKLGDPLLENILKLRYLEGKTTEESSKKLGYSKVSIKMLQAKGLKKLVQLIK